MVLFPKRRRDALPRSRSALSYLGLVVAVTALGLTSPTPLARPPTPVRVALETRAVSAWAPRANPAVAARRKHAADVKLWMDTLRFWAAYNYVPSPYSDATWWRIAIAETGGDVHAHGSVYSSAFGVLNGRPGGSGGVWGEADSPASAERILAGTATYDEELRMAKREANQYGIHAWSNPVADTL